MAAQSSNWTPEEPSSSIGPDTSSRSDDSDIFVNHQPPKESHFSKNFKNREVLGKGGFGIVFKVLNETDQKEYAIKLIKLCQDDKKAVREAKILAEFNHQNVVRYHTAWDECWPCKESTALSDSLTLLRIGGSGNTDKNSVSPTTNGKAVLFIQMELCCTNLRSVINEKKHKVHQLLQYLDELIEGLKYIHNKGYMHRDLNPNNIFIGYDNRIKIGDFGLARLLLNSEEPCDVLSKSVGTLLYRAPEVFTEKYDKRADIYSLGIILFEILYPMSTEMERNKRLHMLRSADVTFSEDFLNHAPTWHKALLHSVLNHDPEKRPSLESISAQMSENRETINRELLKNMFRETNKCHRNNTLDVIKALALAHDLEATLQKTFKKHGAFYFPTPLLTPHLLPKQSASAVELGMKVNLLHNPRENFAHYIVLNQIRSMIWYDSFQTVEDQGAHQHPNQKCMSDFDIITDDPDFKETDAQVLHLLVEVDKTIANMPIYSNRRNILTTYLAINHADVVKSILRSVGVSENNLDNVLSLIGKEGFQGLNTELPFSINMTKLERILEFHGTAEDVEGFVLQEVNEEYSPTVKKAFQCMNDTLKYLYDNIYCPGNENIWKPNITIDIDHCSNVHLYSGILFSITASEKGPSPKKFIVADGGRYDRLLQSLRSKFGLEEENAEKYGCGITVYTLNIANHVREFILPDLMVIACCRNTGPQERVHQLTQYLRRAGFNCAPKIYNCDSEVETCRQDPNILCTIEILPSEIMKITHQYLALSTSGMFTWTENRNPNPPTVIVSQKCFINTILTTLPTEQSPSGMFTGRENRNPNPPAAIVSQTLISKAIYATVLAGLAGREGDLE